MKQHQKTEREFLPIIGFLTTMVIGVVLIILITQSSPTALPSPITGPPSSTPTVTEMPPTTAEPNVGIQATATSSLTTTIPTSSITPVTTMSQGDQLATPIPLGGKEVSDFSFAVCGDNRGGDEIYREALRLVQEDGAAFLANTGDLVNYGNAYQFQHFAELMNGFSLPFFPVAGNHDAAGGLLDEYLVYSGAPAVHYSFDYGLGHFVMVDSHHGVLQNQELDWLEADLAATDQPLKIVFIHHPPFDPDGTDYILLAGNLQFMTLMEKYNVSHVFCGHIHAYVEGIRNGVQYIITGGCGAILYPAEHPRAFYHYVRVTINGTNVSTEVVKIEP